MKRTLTAAVAVLAFMSGLALAQSTEANDAYIKAMTAQSPAQKAQLLRDFLAKFGGKGSEYENFANANLAVLTYPGKSLNDTIGYGEKALQMGGLDDLTKYQVLITMAGAYIQAGQNLDKGKGLAQQAIDVCKSAKGKEGANVAQLNQLMGAGYYVQGEALEKTKDYRGAAEAYANSYAILKNPQILASLRKLGKSLYEAKAYAEAEKVFKVVAATTKDPEISLLYAGALFKGGKTDEALAVYKDVYSQKKNGDVAYNIGIILAKKAQKQPALAGEAVNYLLDASFLSPANSKNAMSMAESLFFNSYKELKWNETVNKINALSQKIEETTKTYNDKYGGKDVEDLKESEKAEMNVLLTTVDEQKKELEKLKESQNVAMAKFNAQIEETKKRLGIR
jgi:tetratricopeptide (TPR) repeat protein